MTTNPNAGKLIRVKLPFERDFTQVPNSWIRDRRPSWTARAILVFLLSHTDGFEVTIETLATYSEMGADGVRTAVKQLERYGYLKRYRRREKGRLVGGTIWQICDPHGDKAPEDWTQTLPGLEEIKPRSAPKGDLPNQAEPNRVQPTQVEPTTIEDHLQEELNLTNPEPSVSERERPRDLVESLHCPGAPYRKHKLLKDHCLWCGWDVDTLATRAQVARS